MPSDESPAATTKALPNVAAREKEAAPVLPYADDRLQPRKFSILLLSLMYGLGASFALVVGMGVSPLGLRDSLGHLRWPWPSPLFLVCSGMFVLAVAAFIYRRVFGIRAKTLPWSIWFLCGAAYVALFIAMESLLPQWTYIRWLDDLLTHELTRFSIIELIYIFVTPILFAKFLVYRDDA